MPNYNAIQYLDTAHDEFSAVAMKEALSRQVDYIAGRVIPPSDVYPTWRVQVLFEDCGHDLPLCDGLRRVYAPASFIRRLEA